MDTEAPRVLSTAVAPNNPVRPNKVINILIGSISSFLLSLMILLISYLRNDKIVTAEDILKYTGVSTLVVIPAFTTPIKKRKSIFQVLKTRMSRRKRA